MRRAFPLGPVIDPRMPLIALGALLVVAAIGSALLSSSQAAPAARVQGLADRLGPATWALAVPVSWLAAPIPELREGEVLDLLGTRAGERATAAEVATGLRVITADEDALVLELSAEAAASIAEARARGLALIPLLRSNR